MRPRSLDDLDAPQQTVSLAINSDLYGQAMHLGINMSLVAEDALAREVAEQVRAEVR